MTKSDTEFTFQGIWQLDYKFTAFEGLKSKPGSALSNGEVKLIIEDELSETPDPNESQINAIHFITENAELINSSLRSSLPAYYEEAKSQFGILDSDENPYFPNVKSMGDFREHFAIRRVYILVAEKEAHAYYGLGANCSWDEEHGLGFIMHKDRIVCIGQADILYRSLEPYKDNGTYELEQKRRKAAKKRKPVLYKAHSKYGTLKPKQKTENEMYGRRLIERGFNAEFKELVEKGLIDINHVKPHSMTLLARAIQFNNLELGEYIFSLNPKDKTEVIQWARKAEMVELCLANGIDINEESAHKQTLYTEIKLLLRGRKSQLKFAKEKDPTIVNETEAFLKFIVSKGARE